VKLLVELGPDAVILVVSQFNPGILCGWFRKSLAHARSLTDETQRWSLEESIVSVIDTSEGVVVEHDASDSTIFGKSPGMGCNLLRGENA
jgi:hypothetical protein